MEIMFTSFDNTRLRLFEEIAAEDKDLRLYEKLFHEIFNEREGAHPVNEMIFRMKNRI